MKFKTVAEYMSALPPEQKSILEQVRQIIKTEAPQAKEVISYNMPAFKWKGMLVWYAAYKNHIGLYPKTKAIEIFKKELAGYTTSKGAIQFPIDQLMPIELIKKIVQFRLKENAKA